MQVQVDGRESVCMVYRISHSMWSRLCEVCEICVTLENRVRQYWVNMDEMKCLEVDVQHCKHVLEEWENDSMGRIKRKLKAMRIERAGVEKEMTEVVRDSMMRSMEVALTLKRECKQVEQQVASSANWRDDLQQSIEEFSRCLTIEVTENIQCRSDCLLGGNILLVRDEKVQFPNETIMRVIEVACSKSSEIYYLEEKIKDIRTELDWHQQCLQKLQQGQKLTESCIYELSILIRRKPRKRSSRKMSETLPSTEQRIELIHSKIFQFIDLQLTNHNIRIIPEESIENLKYLLQNSLAVYPRSLSHCALLQQSLQRCQQHIDWWIRCDSEVKISTLTKMLHQKSDERVALWKELLIQLHRASIFSGDLPK